MDFIELASLVVDSIDAHPWYHLLLLKWIKLSFEKTKKTVLLQCVPKILKSCVCTDQIIDKLGKGSSALEDAAIFISLRSVTLFDVCFNKHIVCFVWTWRLFTSFCFLQELLWRSLIHAFVSLHRQEPKKKKGHVWNEYLYYSTIYVI